eukprot:g4044.t1
MGGGTDTDSAFKQLVQWSGDGDVLVIRASGDDAYNPYILSQVGANPHSVTTLLTKDRQAASDPDVLALVDRADAIFFAGGDQWTYLQEWRGTPLQQRVQAAMDERGVPVGGTSAGCDVLGGAIYTAANDTVESSEALDDPFNLRVTIQPSSFVNFSVPAVLYRCEDNMCVQRATGGTLGECTDVCGGGSNASAPSMPVFDRHMLLLSTSIIDTHFVTRDRMGRLFAFLARLRTDLARPSATAIGIDEQTAIAIDAAGKGTMLQQSSEGGRAFVLLPTAGVAPAKCKQGHKLTWKDVPVQLLDAQHHDSFDFASMTGGVAARRYTISVNNGKMSPDDPYAP